MEGVEATMIVTVDDDSALALPESMRARYNLSPGSEVLITPIDHERFEVPVLPPRVPLTVLIEKYAMDGPAPGMDAEREAIGDALAAEFAREVLVDVAHRWIEQGWQRGDADAVLAMYAPDFVDLSNPSGRPGTREENVAGIRDLYAAFPDFHTEIDELAIDEQAASVSVRWSATGTHRSAFFGVAPTGKRITFRGIEILHVRDGLIVQRSGEWDAYDLLKQLGVLD